MFCNSCGAELSEDVYICSQCGKNPRGNYEQEIKTIKPENNFAKSKSRIVAGLLQIFLGYFGAGRFYLGYTHIALSQLFLNVMTRGLTVLWPIIDGIMILCGRVKSDAHGEPLA